MAVLNEGVMLPGYNHDDPEAVVDENNVTWI